MSGPPDVDNEQDLPDAWLMLPRMVAVSLAALAVGWTCSEMIGPVRSPGLDLAMVFAPIVFSAVITSLFGMRMLLRSYGSAAALGSLVVAVGGPMLVSPLLIPLGVAATPAAGWALGAVLGQGVCQRRTNADQPPGASSILGERGRLPVTGKQAAAILGSDCWIRYGAAGAGLTIALMVCAVVAVQRGVLSNDALMYGAIPSVAWAQATAVTAFLGHVQRTTSRRGARR